MKKTWFVRNYLITAKHDPFWRSNIRRSFFKRRFWLCRPDVSSRWPVKAIQIGPWTIKARMMYGSP